MTSYEERIRKINEKRTKALADQNSRTYALLTDLLGIEPEDQFLYERGFVGLNERESIKQSYDKSQKNKKLTEDEKRKFVDAVQKSNISIDDIFSGSEEKIILLRDVLGYKTLKTSNGNMPVEECSAERIGQVCRNNYYSFRKQLSGR